jgi:hypothetical protein
LAIQASESATLRGRRALHRTRQFRIAFPDRAAVELHTGLAALRVP